MRTPTEENRRRTLQTLLDERGKDARKVLAEKLGHANQSRISHLLSGHRPISEEVATEVEKAMGLAPGTLDKGAKRPRSAAIELPEVVDEALLEASVRAVINAATEAHAKVLADKTAQAVRMVYHQAATVGHIDPMFVKMVIGLIR